MITQASQKNKRYLPHETATKEGAVKLYRQSGDVNFVVRRYHISKASLMRWNRQYDGTRASLEPGSHRSHHQHPNAHTEEELTWIRNDHRRNPNISVSELYGKASRLGYRRKVESTKTKSRHMGKYDTPAKLEQKRQMDAKYVPQACYAGRDDEVFFQYTMIDEASRERFIFPYKEQSSFSTVDFVRRAIAYFGWHSGKVERSHRSDQERFYNFLRFYSYDDLLLQMKRYLCRSNRIPMAVLGWRSPLSMRALLSAAAK